MADEARSRPSEAPTFTPDEIARRTFPPARRGIDGVAVRAFLEAVARDVRQLHAREAELRADLAESRMHPPDAVIDEQTLVSAVGAETARVLQAAHEAARDLVLRAEHRAESLVATAEATLVARREEARAAAESTRADADAESQARLATARAEAEVIVEQTKAECRDMIHEAREARRRILADLAARRRLAQVQLEQLGAGREILLGAVNAVGATIEELRDALARAEQDALEASSDARHAPAAEADEAADVVAAPPPVEASDATVPSTVAGEEMPLEEARPTVVVLGKVPEAPPSDPPASGSPLADSPRADSPVADSPSPDPLTTEMPAVEVPAVEVPAVEVPAAEVPGAGESSGEDPTLTSETSDRAEAPTPDEANPNPTAGDDTNPATIGAVTGEPVGALFARIRAGRAADVEQARSVLARDPEVDAPLVDAPEVEAKSPPVDGLIGEDSATVPREDEPADQSPPPDDDPEDPDRLALARHDALLGPVLNRLTRALKKALQDDQNELLDALRHASDAAGLTNVLAQAEPERTARYGDAAHPFLDEAWRAGIDFGSWPPGESKGQATPGATVVGDAASHLAAEIATALGQRLAEAAPGAGGDTDVLAGLVGAAYREWRGQRIERVAGDHTTRIFAAAELESLGEEDGLLVRWVVDDGDGHCPDCDDNALSGPQRPGEPFPTGQHHPPIHPGCRCLLVPQSA